MYNLKMSKNVHAPENCLTPLPNPLLKQIMVRPSNADSISFLLPLLTFKRVNNSIVFFSKHASFKRVYRPIFRDINPMHTEDCSRQIVRYSSCVIGLADMLSFNCVSGVLRRSRESQRCSPTGKHVFEGLVRLLPK